MHYREHNPPHFHAAYNGVEAQFDLHEGAFVKGALPSRQSRLVLAWYELHKAELLEMWKTRKFNSISPLS